MTSAGNIVLSRPADVTLGESGWFRVLLDEAVERNALVAPTPPVLSVNSALDALWASGVLVGAPFERRACAVTGRNDSEAAFIELLRFQLAHVVRLYAAHGPDGSDAARIRWFAAAVLASMSGEAVACGQLEEAVFGQTPPLDEREERRLLGIVGSRLLRRAYLLGHPPGGLPLHAGLGLLDTRTALRLAQGRLLGKGSLQRRSGRAVLLLSRLKAQWIELLAGLPGLVDLGSADHRRTLERQVRASALVTTDRRALVRAFDSPRHPARILRPNPSLVRRLLLEQTVLAAVLHRHWKGALEAAVRDATLAIEGTTTLIDNVQLRAAAFVVEHADPAARLLVHPRAERFDATVTAAADRLQSIASAIAQEMRETGDLGLLLARLAQGESLSREERSRMKEQLADLARIVPALAIFAAPGGMLLLPAVLRLLPFDLRPSAFRGRSAEKPEDG